MKIVKILVLITLSAMVFTSCKQEGCTDSAAINYEEDADDDDGSCVYEGLPEITIKMEHSVDGEDLQFDEILYMNEAGNNYEVTKLVYFISDVNFNNTDGDDFFIDVDKYVDAEDLESLSWMTGLDLPEGNYESMTFVFGIIEESNISGMFTSLPESSMEWPEPNGGGYHYMRLEHTSDGNVYLTHCGPTGNVDYSSTLTMPFNETLIIRKSANKDNLTVTLNMNINNWYNDPVYDFTLIGGAIMMNAAAQQLLKDNTGDLFSMTSVLN